LSGPWGRRTLDPERPPSGPGPVGNTHFRSGGSRDSDTRLNDCANPILKPSAAAAVKRQGKPLSRGGVFANRFKPCRPQPMVLVLQELEMEVLQPQDEVSFLHLLDDQVRHDRLNRSHHAQVTPTCSSDSVGHCEDHRRVVDGTGPKVEPLSIMHRYGTAFTRMVHVVERFRLMDPEVALKAEQVSEKANGKALG
jgi:hypothetical protein